MSHGLNSCITRQPSQVACALLVLLPVSSPSNTLGIPTRSMGIPNSASASMFKGCSRASLDAKLADVYCPLERPVLGMSSSLGGHGGGGSALEYLIRARKSCGTTLDRCELIVTFGGGESGSGVDALWTSLKESRREAPNADALHGHVQQPRRYVV